MDFSKLVPVEWSSRRVLTTAQLAEFYGCDANNIKKNFNANKDRFVEGKHYFKLEGANLSAFKASLVTAGDLQNLRVTGGDLQNLCSAECGLQISSMTRVLYLWTVRGAARHAKMLSTDKAWDVFEELEDNYFNPKPSIISEPAHVVKRKCHAIFPGYACVYVLLMSDGTVKIGFSGNPRARVAKIKRDSNLTVNDLYMSPFMPREVAHLIEWACQEKFSSRRVEGEFFSVKFETACAAVNVFVSAVNILSSVPKHYIANEKFLVDKNSI